MVEGRTGENMKITLWTALAVVVISMAAFAVYHTFIPETESDAVRSQYKSHLHALDETKFQKDFKYRAAYERKSKEFQIALALAYNRDKKPDDAIVIIEELIKQNRDTQYRLFGRLMPRGSWVYGYDANYYEMLANAFDLKKDNDSRNKALMNKYQALDEEKRLTAVEKSYQK